MVEGGGEEDILKKPLQWRPERLEVGKQSDLVRENKAGFFTSLVHCAKQKTLLSMVRRGSVYCAAWLSKGGVAQLWCGVAQ